MATVTEESSSSRSLLTEMFAGSIYKGRQGRIVRQLTCLTVWLASVVGAWQLYEALASGLFGEISWLTAVAVSTVAGFIGVWFGFRIVNWPKFADFLISVESEMTKVSWPSKNELYRAAIVVIFTMALMAITLFLFDLLWQVVFDWLRVS